MTRSTEPPGEGSSPDELAEVEAFRSLYLQYYSRVRAFFEARAFSREDAQDLTQETFLRVFRAIGRFRGEGNIGSWLFQIASNVYRNELRFRHARRRRSWNERSIDAYLGEGAEEDSTVSDHAERSLDLPPVEPASLASTLARERSQLLAKAIDDLPAAWRRCVVLRAHHGLKYREIAAVLNISLETVKLNLHNAKARLKHQLGEQT